MTAKPEPNPQAVVATLTEFALDMHEDCCGCVRKEATHAARFVVWLAKCEAQTRREALEEAAQRVDDFYNTYFSESPGQKVIDRIKDAIRSINFGPNDTTLRGGLFQAAIEALIDSATKALREENERLEDLCQRNSDDLAFLDQCRAENKALVEALREAVKVGTVLLSEKVPDQFEFITAYAKVDKIARAALAAHEEHIKAGGA